MATIANPDHCGWSAVEHSAEGSGLSQVEQSDQVFVDHYCCPEEFVNIGLLGTLSEQAGFFRFGPEAVCYGRCSAFAPSIAPELPLIDALEYVRADESEIALPFDVAEAVSALRYERYVPTGNGSSKKSRFQQLERAAYYAIRPLMPVPLRKHLQRYSLRGWATKAFPSWPVDTSVEAILESVMALNLRTQKAQEIPFIWFWPEGAQACAVMTHDVETTAGRDFCDQLMDINDSYGIKSSFQVIPERRYSVPDSYLKRIRERGFEVNVHDLNHDGNLFQDYDEFKRRSVLINKYGKAFDALGFRSAVLYRNIDWFGLLDFPYDMSIPNVGHLDPQHGGCCTTFPYFIGEMLEIPVTMTQDYSLFNILRSYSLDLWEKQVTLILNKHGVMNFIVHPDYIRAENEQRVYRNLLARLAQLRETAGVWTPLPGKLNEWWRQRNLMKLVKRNGNWEVVGEGKERARIAFARLENDKVVYTV
jgi:hypothetical protein